MFLRQIISYVYNKNELMFIHVVFVGDKEEGMKRIKGFCFYFGR